MSNTQSAFLEFNPQLNRLSKKKELRDGLSTAIQIGDTLWVTNDETISIERLSRQSSNDANAVFYGEHVQFSLNDYLILPVPPSPGSDDIEADLEGLAYNGGYLWLVGSHSLKRGKPDNDDPVAKNFKQLSKVTSDGNRFLLARIPLVEETYTLRKEVEQGGKKLTAAQLEGDDKGNDLTLALANDEHLKSFLAVPGKDNGFDIEGLAVAGDRVFIGLRGPVLRGWAVILEVQLEENASILKLKKIGANGSLYRKHFLQLGGLGIRDLIVWDSDLLILAGPTMDLDGPVAVFRWKGGIQSDQESVVFRDNLEKVIDIPYGQGVDHAEGMTLFSTNGSEADSVLIVYDSASKNYKTGISTAKADIFPLP